MTVDTLKAALLANASSGTSLTPEQAAEAIATAVIETIKQADIILAPTTGLTSETGGLVTGEMIYTIE